MNTPLPFCFRCRKTPKYQLSLRIRAEDGAVEDGPSWPLCYPCFMAVDWNEILRPTVQGYEEPS